MGFNDDEEDPFDSLVREFFGKPSRGMRQRRSRFIEGEDEERVIDVVDVDDKIYLIFEMPGYSEDDIEVSVSNKIIQIAAKKHDTEEIKEYLAQKLSKGIQFKRALPDYINTKTFKHTLRHGILEICFSKRDDK